MSAVVPVYTLLDEACRAASSGFRALWSALRDMLRGLLLTSVHSERRGFIFLVVC